MQIHCGLNTVVSSGHQIMTSALYYKLTPLVFFPKVTAGELPVGHLALYWFLTLWTDWFIHLCSYSFYLRTLKH